jgi:hypothetical protein
MARSTWSRAWLFAVLLGALPGCGDVFGDKDAHQPGNLLGTFHVTATRTANTCGEGALGTQPTWAFDVKLARDPGAIFWNNGVEMIHGDLDADLVTFHFDTGVVINMRMEADGPRPPCSISRHDQAKGVLSAPGDDVKGFSGSLAYDFAPTAGSMCEDLIDSPTPIVATLPCGFAYKLEATRIEPGPP